MDWDDVRPPPAAKVAVGESLEALGVAELDERVRVLEAEIARVKEELERKRRHEAAASELFFKR